LSTGSRRRISESLGWGTVAINLYRPAEGDFEVTAVHGNEGAREALLGTTRPADAWTPFLAERFLWRGAYLIPHDEGVWAGMPSHVPDRSISLDPNAWHPEDALVVPMRGADGTLLGVVSVDEPQSGLRPSDEELDVLVAFAEHVIAAFEGVQVSAEVARDRASLRRLLDVSDSLVDLDTVDSVLESVAPGIQDAQRKTQAPNSRGNMTRVWTRVIGLVFPTHARASAAPKSRKPRGSDGETGVLRHPRRQDGAEAGSQAESHTTSTTCLPRSAATPS
jgi:GAF domain-containing protein